MMSCHSLLILCSILAASCSGSGVDVTDFGSLSSGETTHLYTITNKGGSSVSVSDYGLRIVSINVPDRNGKQGDVIVGYGDAPGFENADNQYVGCVLGRYANRLSSDMLKIDNDVHLLDANECREGRNVVLHGGQKGFNFFVWDAEILPGAVRFHRISPDGEEGFPGNLDCTVTYSWSDDNTLEICYEATTDKPTVVNLSNHTYFNPRAVNGEYVMSCILMVDADSCIINDNRFIPDHIVPVEGTALDFRTARRMDSRMEMEFGNKVPVGSWLINGWDGTLRKAADLYDPVSGRGVETWTTEPNILTFAGRHWNGTEQGKYGPLEKFSGMIFETLHPADSPNQSRFPSTVLLPGDTYRSVTRWHFYSK